MSLYLGKIGRRILNYTATHPRLNRALDAFGKVAHKAALGLYTPGLTREIHKLFQECNHGDKIQVLPDGFYRGDHKIAGNTYISEVFRVEKVQEFIFDAQIGPEQIISSARQVPHMALPFTLLPLFFLACLNLADRKILPAFLSEHLGTFSFGSLFVPLKVFIDSLAYTIFKNHSKFAEKMQKITGLYWGTVTTGLCYYEGIGISKDFYFAGTPDFFDIPIPLYLITTTYLANIAIFRPSLAKLLNKRNRVS